MDPESKDHINEAIFEGLEELLPMLQEYGYDQLYNRLDRFLEERFRVKPTHANLALAAAIVSRLVVEKKLKLNNGLISSSNPTEEYKIDRNISQENVDHVIFGETLEKITEASKQSSEVETDINSNEEFEILEPFDVSRIDIESTTLSMQNIIDRLKHGELELDTEFQRAAGVWGVERQSRLIESILIRFPLPAFYFDSSQDTKWLIVDGLQRIFTIKNFVVDKKLKLEGLEFLNNPTFTGKTFDELPRDFQRRLNETKITAYLIKATTPDEVKYNLFKRINTGGLSLTPQEIRHALNQGVPAKFVKKLADLEEFRSATAFSISSKRMEDRDFATRFLAFYIKNYSEYQPDLDSFLNEQMAATANYSEAEQDSIALKFQKALFYSQEIWGKFAFRKQLNFDERRRPINKALFEVITVNFARRSLSELSWLITNKEQVQNELISAFTSDRAFFDSFTMSTGSKNAVIKRHGTFNLLIKNLLEQIS